LFMLLTRPYQQLLMHHPLRLRRAQLRGRLNQGRRAQSRELRLIRAAFLTICGARRSLFCALLPSQARRTVPHMNATLSSSVDANPNAQRRELVSALCHRRAAIEGIASSLMGALGESGLRLDDPLSLQLTRVLDEETARTDEHIASVLLDTNVRR